ncbi:unnamed protein product [Linum trigynum]|uniref:Uncharacterized protein n=1 Tax=Linum trigynum TaxID=586398 RepID=A0AAV2D7Y6_9ROSI
MPNSTKIRMTQSLMPQIKRGSESSRNDATLNMKRQRIESISRRSPIKFSLRVAVLDHKIGIKEFNRNGISAS